MAPFLQMQICQIIKKNDSETGKSVIWDDFSKQYGTKALKKYQFKWPITTFWCK